jgi:hypothetical protein
MEPILKTGMSSLLSLLLTDLHTLCLQEIVWRQTEDDNSQDEIQLGLSFGHKYHTC